MNAKRAGGLQARRVTGELVYTTVYMSVPLAGALRGQSAPGVASSIAPFLHYALDIDVCCARIPDINGR